MNAALVGAIAILKWPVSTVGSLWNVTEEKIRASLHFVRFADVPMLCFFTFTC